jgi:hypothetical protein
VAEKSERPVEVRDNGLCRLAHYGVRAFEGLFPKSRAASGQLERIYLNVIEGASSPGAKYIRVTACIGKAKKAQISPGVWFGADKPIWLYYDAFHKVYFTQSV